MKYRVTVVLLFLIGHSVLGAQLIGEINDCGLTLEAKELAQLIVKDGLQQRQRLICDRTLSQVADKKARLMAERGMVMHVLGRSPNTALRDAGFELPSYYGAAFSNQVEAIAGGYSSAEDVWYAFKHSEAHRSHLLGEIPFYEEQDKMGVGFFRDYSTPHDYYWAVYISKGRTVKPSPQFNTIPNKGTEMIAPTTKEKALPQTKQ